MTTECGRGVGCPAIRVARLLMADRKRCHGAVADGHTVAAESAQRWRESLARLTGGQAPLQAAGVAVLNLAWQHRAQLLG